MGSFVDNPTTACGFAVLNFFIHGGILGSVTWFLGFHLQLEEFSIPVSIGGITVNVNQQMLASLDGAEAIIGSMDIIKLVLKLVGIIPIGLGTFACLLVMIGFLARNSCRCGFIMSGVVAGITTVLYLILTLAGVAILVVINNEDLMAYLQEMVEYVIQ